MTMQSIKKDPLVYPNKFILNYDKKKDLWNLASNNNIYFENDVVEKLREEPLLKGLIGKELSSPNELHFQCTLIIGLDLGTWEVDLPCPEGKQARHIGIASGNIYCSEDMTIVCQIK